MSLEGKTAVITGASRGIGAAVARMLHERGRTSVSPPAAATTSVSSAWSPSRATCATSTR